MPRKLFLVGAGALVAGLCAVAVCLLHSGRAPQPAALNASADSAMSDVPFDQTVEVLLRERATDDRAQQSPFFTALVALSRRHGFPEKEYIPAPYVDEGRACVLKADGTRYVVVVLGGNDLVIPGRDTQHLLLLTAEGRLLDRTSCAINNRLTRESVDSGRFFTEAAEQPQRDGAQLVVRYVPEEGGSISGNWSHEITHGGREFSFYWGERRRDRTPAPDWETNGLCRLAIRDGKFAVVFPAL